jgi:hypothetical protein
VPGTQGDRPALHGRMEGEQVSGAEGGIERIAGIGTTGRAAPQPIGPHGRQVHAGAHHPIRHPLEVAPATGVVEAEVRRGMEEAPETVTRILVLQQVKARHHGSRNHA